MDNFGQYSPRPTPPSSNEYQLKWHKFLIYFALWFSALGYLGSAISCFNGTQYGDNSEQNYNKRLGLFVN